MTTVPERLKEAEERAMKLHEEAYKQVEETAEAAQDEQVGEREENDDALSTEVAEHADQPDTSADYARLLESHKVLQGKYNAEVPRMAEQIRELKEQLKDAVRVGEKAKQEASEAKERLEAKLDAIRNDFGDDLADVVGEIATRQVETKPDNSQLENDRFWRQLNRAVPGFDALNRSQDFIQWLQKPDELTGVARQVTLNEAGQDYDLVTVVEMVNAFKQERGATKPPSLDDQVAPKRKPRQELPAQKPIYTIDDFVKLQRDIQLGHYIGREAEARALERDIHQALMSA